MRREGATMRHFRERFVEFRLHPEHFFRRDAMMKAMRDFLAGAAIALSSFAAVACGDTEDPPPAAAPPGLSTGSTCPSSSTLTYENFGTDFFARYCTRCHSETLVGAERHGAPGGYNWDDIEAVREHAAEIDKMAAAGPDRTNTTMPPSVPRPLDEERLNLGEWLACGAPD
jgi:cytochrome c5